MPEGKGLFPPRDLMHSTIDGRFFCWSPGFKPVGNRPRTYEQNTKTACPLGRAEMHRLSPDSNPSPVNLRLTGYQRIVTAKNLGFQVAGGCVR